MVPALQSRPSGWRRQSACSRRAWHSHPIPVARGAGAGIAGRDSRALCADRRGRRRERPHQAPPGVAALSPARCRALSAATGQGRPRGLALPGAALGRQRQEQFDCLAGASAIQAQAQRCARRTRSVRFSDRGHRPQEPGQANRAHHQGLRPCGFGLRSFRQVGRPGQVPAVRQGHHRHHGAEIPAHSRSGRRQPSRQQLRADHRRGPFEPGRQDLGQGRRGAQAAPDGKFCRR